MRNGINLKHKIQSALLEPNDSVQDSAVRHQSRLLAAMLLILLFTGFINEIIFTLQQYAFGYRGFWFMIAVLPILILLYFGSRTKHIHTVAFVSILAISASIYYVTFSYERIDPYMLTYLVIPLLLAGHFLNMRQVIFFFGLNIAAMVFLPSGFPDISEALYFGVLPQFLMSALLVLVLTHNRNLLEQERIKALVAQEARFRMLLEQTFEAICVHVNGEIREVNAGFVRMFGFTLEAAREIPIDRLFLPMNAQVSAYHLPLRTEHLSEQLVQRKDGSTFYAEVIRYGDPESSENGQALAFRDISIRRSAEESIRKEVEERRHTEAALRASQQALRRSFEDKQQLLSAITSLLIGIDSRGNVTHWNEPASRGLGIPADQAIGQPFRSLSIAWDWTLITNEMERCRSLDKKISLPEFTLPLPDGKRKVLGISLTPMPESEAGKTGILLLGSDITEAIVMQQQLEQKNKLESIGQLAAGIAHEINTPSQFISNNLRFLQDQFLHLQNFLSPIVRPGSPATAALSAAFQKAFPPQEIRQLDYLLQEYPKAIAQSVDGIARISDIVGALRDFSHPGSGKRSLLDINKGLENTIAVARNEWKYVARVETEFDPQLPPVECYPGELNQAFLNIIVYAAHAIRESIGDQPEKLGAIKIRTACLGEVVEVRISDSGAGIPKEIQNRIFDPFFTTKDYGKGTGQGLSITHTIIVQKHKGTIHFESLEGQGTTFIICLPIKPGIQLIAG